MHSSCRSHATSGLTFTVNSLSMFSHTRQPLPYRAQLQEDAFYVVWIPVLATDHPLVWLAGNTGDWTILFPRSLAWLPQVAVRVTSFSRREPLPTHLQTSLHPHRSPCSRHPAPPTKELPFPRGSHPPTELRAAFPSAPSLKHMLFCSRHHARRSATCT